MTSFLDRLTCVAGFACIVGCGGQSVIEIGGMEDAVVFAVHLDEARKPISTSGPYRLDNGTAVTTEIPPDETGRSNDTEFVAFDLAKVEEKTAALDDSARQNLRFVRSSKCWTSSECDFELKLELPSENPVVRELGQSIGWREFVPTVDLTTMPETSEFEWLSQVSLRAPFDQHLNETTNLVQFPEAVTWANTEMSRGIRDFFPIDSDRVVIAANAHVCLIQRSTPAADYCKEPGASTISASELAGVPGAILRRVAQARNTDGYINRFYLIVQNGTTYRLFSIAFEGLAFGERNLLALETEGMLDIAVAIDGSVIVTMFPPDGETRQRVLEFAPDGTQRPTTEIAWPVAGSWSDRLAATTSRQVPFVVSHGNGFARRVMGGQGDDAWLTQEATTDQAGTEGISAVVTEQGLNVWVVRDGGISNRFREEGGFQLELVEWAMPDEYIDLVDPAQGGFGNRLREDLRSLWISDPNNAYALVKDLAVVIRFNPTAQNALDLRTVSIFHPGLIESTWPRIGDELERLRFEERDGVLWIGGGATLYSLQTRPE